MGELIELKDYWQTHSKRKLNGPAKVIQLRYTGIDLRYGLASRLCSIGSIITLPVREIEVDHKKRVLSSDQGGHIRYNGQKTIK